MAATSGYIWRTHHVSSGGPGVVLELPNNPQRVGWLASVRAGAAVLAMPTEDFEPGAGIVCAINLVTEIYYSRHGTLATAGWTFSAPAPATNFTVIEVLLLE